MLVEYIRRGGNKKYHIINGRRKQSLRSGGIRRGAMVALLGEDGEVRTGWSLCHRLDKFDRDRAVQVAKARAENGKKYEIPRSIEQTYARFQNSAANFFNKDNHSTAHVIGQATLDAAKS